MSYFTDGDAPAIIREAYGRVHSDGSDVASAFYSPEELERLPRAAVELALGHPVSHASLAAGEVVLDLGCGTGIDTLLAARAVGPAGLGFGADVLRGLEPRGGSHCRWTRIRRRRKRPRPGR